VRDLQRDVLQIVNARAANRYFFVQVVFEAGLTRNLIIAVREIQVGPSQFLKGAVPRPD
jgi:hypothetical protein